MFSFQSGGERNWSGGFIRGAVHHTGTVNIDETVYFIGGAGQADKINVFRYLTEICIVYILW